jgi:rfaE bifunctional protein nucleotidyltransferase chain/domain
MSAQKIKTLDEVVRLRAQFRKLGKKLVFTNGCFDILHVGHVRYLAQAKALGDVLVVGVNSDASVKKIKGPARPLNSQADRAEVLAALRSVDYVFVFNEPDPRYFLDAVKPSFHAKGGDYRLDQIIEREVVEKNGGKIVLLDMVKGRSTTKLLKRMAKR